MDNPAPQSEFSDRKRCREDNPEGLPSPEQNSTKRKKRRKKNKGAVNPQQLQVCPATLVVVGPTDPTTPKDTPQIMKNAEQTIPVCPKPATPIDQATIPIDTEQKTVKKRRIKKRKSALNGAEPNQHDTEPPATPIQGPAIPTHPEQKTTSKKRKKKRKSALKSQGEEPNQHNGNPPETPVQRPMCPIDPATPIDPEQKTTKKKRKKKRKSALKSQGTQPNQHNADPTVQALIYRTRPSAAKFPFTWPAESSMALSESNAKPPAKSRVQRARGLTVTGVPFERHGESSMICRTCQQPSHKSERCPRLKCLSKDEEICFFCGEIGHSLGKCSVSKAGGGRFAKCLLCYAQGHFSNNCPRNGHGIDSKVVAANGPINKTVETEGKPVVEVTNM